MWRLGTLISHIFFSLISLIPPITLLFLQLLHLNFKHFIRILQNFYLFLQLRNLPSVFFLFVFDQTLQRLNYILIFIIFLNHLFTYLLILYSHVIKCDLNFPVHFLLIPPNLFDYLRFWIDFNLG
jgi:hypothetical protein